METVAFEIVCCASVNDGNKWFIFRENGVEIKIIKVNGELHSDRKLTEKEIEYLHSNLK